MNSLTYYKNRLKKHPVLHSGYLMILRLLKYNKIIGGGSNKIIKQNALLLKSNIKFRGHGNIVCIESGAKVENYSIKIYGSNNKISIGEKCYMKQGELWMEDDNNELIIGSRTTIQENTQLAAIEGCKIIIGDDCMFSSDIVVRTGDSHSIVDAEGKRINKSEDVHIGDHCWLGHRAMIMKGAVIQQNSIIGAGAIVNKQFEQENSVIAGIPARVIKENVNWRRERI
ncbi:MAG: acyltransferase [Bacteroidales bacterium]|nr:acyltransferase [Bacteroidales bacterium]